VPITGFLAVLLVTVLAYHSYLGTTVIVEDYVTTSGMKILSLMVLLFLYVLAGGAAIFAILRVVFGFSRP
jgi:succinate dehydrogenase hydrophobic anchor subunit